MEVAVSVGGHGVSVLRRSGLPVSLSPYMDVKAMECRVFDFAEHSRVK